MTYSIGQLRPCMSFKNMKTWYSVHSVLWHCWLGVVCVVCMSNFRTFQDLWEPCSQQVLHRTKL